MQVTLDPMPCRRKNAEGGKQTDTFEHTLQMKIVPHHHRIANNGNKMDALSFAATVLLTFVLHADDGWLVIWMQNWMKNWLQQTLILLNDSVSNQGLTMLWHGTLTLVRLIWTPVFVHCLCHPTNDPPQIKEEQSNHFQTAVSAVLVTNVYCSCLLRCARSMIETVVQNSSLTKQEFTEKNRSLCTQAPECNFNPKDVMILHLFFHHQKKQTFSSTLTSTFIDNIRSDDISACKETLLSVLAKGLSSTDCFLAQSNEAQSVFQEWLPLVSDWSIFSTLPSMLAKTTSVCQQDLN